MPLENGRADERVSRGQASERAVYVCEAVSVEMGARRPQLPTAVVCPPGRRRRLRLAITADRDRPPHPVCVFITAGPVIKLFAGGGGGQGEWSRYCMQLCVFITAGPMIKLCAGGAMRYDEPRLVWTSLPITH